MSKKSSPTLIGGFVFGAIILIATAVALFGGREFFSQRLEYVAYFDEATKGLRVGSNVTMNGVRVGYVSDITLLVDQSTYQTLTMVTIEVLPEDLVMTDFGEVVQTLARRATIGHDNLIDEGGLRAQLEMESFVTGSLIVSLNLLPETEAIFRGFNPPHHEIPTVPSSTQAFFAKIREWAEKVGEDFDLEMIAHRVTNILRGLDELSNSEDLRATIAGLNEFVNDDQTQQLMANANAVLGDIRAVAAEANELLRNTDGNIGALADDIRPLIKDLQDVMVQAEDTLLAATNQLKGDSIQMYQLQSTLEEVENAALSLREFFDLLERNPESLISGKK
ncbi:MAG TPA: MlaD family protein [Xanthomonadales bacterium]|nr:MlaD family protein [Xanthomonadales bacterium]